MLDFTCSNEARRNESQVQRPVLPPTRGMRGALSAQDRSSFASRSLFMPQSRLWQGFILRGLISAMEAAR